MNIKSIACLTAALAVGTALADIEIQLGLTKVVSPNKNTIVAVPYKGFTPGANITVADVVKTANLKAGDLCYVMNGEYYDAWELKEGTGGVLAWDVVKQVKLDKNGNPADFTATAADAKFLEPGTALWIVREGVGRDYTQPFYLWGTYEGTVPSSTVTASADGTWNLIANTGDTAVSVNELIAKLTSATWVAGDRIVIPTNGVGVDFIKKQAEGKWTNQSKLGSTLIQPSMGCWVFKKGETNGTISWASAE